MYSTILLSFKYLPSNLLNFHHNNSKKRNYCKNPKKTSNPKKISTSITFNSSIINNKLLQKQPLSFKVEGKYCDHFLQEQSFPMNCPLEQIDTSARLMKISTAKCNIFNNLQEWHVKLRTRSILPLLTKILSLQDGNNFMLNTNQKVTFEEEKHSCRNSRCGEKIIQALRLLVCYNH